MWRSALFLIVLGVPGAFLSAEALRLGAAETLALSPEISKLRLALSFDPDNARIHRLLGSRLCRGEDSYLAEGIEHLRRATQLSPKQALNWSALASACELSGDYGCADEAFQRTLALAPMVPLYEWGAANHYLLANRADEALPHFQRLLKMDQGYDWQIFRVCVRAIGDPDVVFQKVVAPSDNTKFKLSYINYLSSQGEIDSANRAWATTMAHASPFPFDSAQPYLERLLVMGQGQQANEVWQDLEKFGAVKKPASESADNLVFNGDFEELPLNGGLDWRNQNTPYLFVDFADTNALRGKRCLRADFTFPSNKDYVAAFQFVPAAASKEYLLHAFARSQNITSDSGPRLRVIDSSCPTCVDVLSDATVGTTAWHEISLRFSTGPNTQLLTLMVVRLRSRTFPMEISGSFWLDNVTLTPISPAARESSLTGAH